MSRIVKSEKLKTKKQETQVVTLTKNALPKKQTPSRVFKTPTHLNEGIAAADEKEKEKNKNKLLSNAASATSNNARVNLHRTKFQGKTTENSKATQLVPRKTSTTLQQKHVPLRAKQLSSTSKVVKETNQKHSSSPTTNSRKKQNSVLDTPQNVTVCSPPPKKKNDNAKVTGKDDQKTGLSELTRKHSRTLAPDEIIILKRESAKMRSEEKIRKENLPVEKTLAISLKEPVAFEIKFGDENVKERSVSREEVKRFDGGIDKSNEEPNYSDDFDSYESDFETESSAHSLTKSEPPSLDSQLNSDESEHEADAAVQNPIEDIQNDKEGKLDSGHYDMNSNKINSTKTSDIPTKFAQLKGDSLETFTLGVSEQMDSGISTCTTSIPESDSKNIMEVTYGGYTDFYTKPILNQRGSDLLAKIQLDILSFDLFDLKPISYDIFMQTFGKLNTNQNFTQTQDNQMNAEQQTELQETRSIWTQHPAHFDLLIAKNLDRNGMYNQHCCGEITNERQAQYTMSHCELEQSLETLKQLNNQSSIRNSQNYQKRHRKPINYEHLNSFLLRSSLLIDQILGSSRAQSNNTSIETAAHENDQVLKRVCAKSFIIKTDALNTLQVLKLFSNNKHNLLITVHESLPDTNVYSCDFSNLLMVWCANTCDKPLRLLTTWSHVSKVEISNDSSDIVVAALRDGSIALWDLRETHSFCSKLDGYLTLFAATQSLIPTWSADKKNSKLITDLGACLDVKSFRSQPNRLLAQSMFPRTQFVSLYDSGVICVWTLVETSKAFFDLPQIEKYGKLKYSSKHPHTFEYTSPWARVKLIQSTIVNVKEYFETKSHQSQSRFEKTKAFFQKNIYSDEALRELNECTLEVKQQGLRFTSIECGSDNVFICTNRNFILMCSKALKMEKLKRIMINENQFLFPTALKVLDSDQFVAVGLSNGVVMILNCQSDSMLQTNRIEQISTPLQSTATSKDSILDSNSTTGKSCAIQNILLNVQKSYEDMSCGRDYRPSTAACITLIDSKKKPYELRILDQQVIMSGSVLRKNLIQSLELSAEGWHLFALTNGHIRIYDFYLDQEIPSEESPKTGTIIDISTGKCGYRESSLMTLRTNTEVEVHILNK